MIFPSLIGDVYVIACRAVTDPRNGRRVAIKKLPNVFHSLVSCKRVYRELKMLCTFQHENVCLLSYLMSYKNIENLCCILLLATTKWMCVGLHMSLIVCLTLDLSKIFWSSVDQDLNPGPKDKSMTLMLVS